MACKVAAALVLFFATANGYVNLASDAECGLGTFGRQQKIVGGTEAARGEFPFIVSLRHSAKDRHFCGGAILDRTHILTAAHCVERGLQKYVQVLVREYLVNSEEKDVGSYKISPGKFITHEEFDMVRMNNDLAIIKLKEGIIEWDNYTAPVCLADPDGKDEVVGELATVLGWGRLAEGGKRPDVLQKVSVPVVDSESCRGQLSKWFDINEGQMCAGYTAGAQDACQGDSGGPLVVRRNGRYVLTGIVSAGIGCARPGLPGVYTRVSTFYKWIISHMH